MVIGWFKILDVNDRVEMYDVDVCDIVNWY